MNIFLFCARNLLDPSQLSAAAAKTQKISAIQSEMVMIA